MPACSENIDSPQSNCSSGCEGSPEPCISNTSPGGSGSGKRKRRRRRLLTGVSRQRRAANERERRRVQGVNNAFVELKSKIPVMAPDDVSKMETLHLAAKWIAYLTTVLIEDDGKRNWSQDNQKKRVPDSIKSKVEDFLNFELEDFEVVCSELTSSEAEKLGHYDDMGLNLDLDSLAMKQACQSTVHTFSVSPNLHDTRHCGSYDVTLNNDITQYDVRTHSLTSQIYGYHQSDLDCANLLNFLDCQGDYF